MSDSSDRPPDATLAEAGSTTFERAILEAALGDATGAELAELARRHGDGDEAVPRALDVLLGRLRGATQQRREARHRLANALASVLANVELAQTLLSTSPPESEEEETLVEALWHAADGARRAAEILRGAPHVLAPGQHVQGAEAPTGRTAPGSGEL